MSNSVDVPHVVISKDGQTLLTYELTKPITLIGRSRICDIIINDSSISRTHARIVLNGNYTLEDLGSTNGTYLRGYPLFGEVEFGFNDEITLGDGIEVVLRQGEYQPFALETFDTPMDETQSIPPTREVDMSKYRKLRLEDLSPTQDV
jgi:pSer/pThr/pTyr-binding forkhead associated (FHA) protein